MKARPSEAQDLRRSAAAASEFSARLATHLRGIAADLFFEGLRGVLLDHVLRADLMPEARSSECPQGASKLKVSGMDESMFVVSRSTSRPIFPLCVDPNIQTCSIGFRSGQIWETLCLFSVIRPRWRKLLLASPGHRSPPNARLPRTDSARRPDRNVYKTPLRN